MGRLTDLLVARGPRTTTCFHHRDNKTRSGHVMSLGTSALLPSGRGPPFSVTKTTRGEGVGRCRAHAQYRHLEGTFFGTVVFCQ